MMKVCLLRVCLILTLVAILSSSWQPVSTADPAPGAAETSSIFSTSHPKAQFSRHNYIEYIPGTLPIILVAPHGGHLKPGNLPDLPRKRGADNKSQDYTRETAAHLFRLTKGGYPHVIIVHLHPSKLNAAAPLIEAAGRHPETQEAWRSMHDFIDRAKDTITRQWKRGHYFDLHTNGHRERWIEIGTGINRTYLNRSDRVLDPRFLAGLSTIRSLGLTAEAGLLEILRGSTSLGGFLEERGYRVVPSPRNPGPGDGGFFFAGYNTWCHGSRRRGTIDATHVETHYSYLVNNRIRRTFSKDLAECIKAFVEKHYGIRMTDWQVMH